MKKRLTNKPSTEKPINTKFTAVPDAISRIAKDIGQRDYPETYKKQIMYEWLDYAGSANRRISLEGFCFFKGLCSDTLRAWGAKDIWIQKMLDHGNRIIGDRRYDMAAFREMDKDMFKWNQHLFDPKALEIHQMWAQLNKKEDAQGSQKIEVYLDGVPVSDKVPIKKDKE